VTRQNAITAVLWMAFILALIASFTHVAFAFNTLEYDNRQWVGYVAALAVDSGLAALAYSIQQRKRARQPIRILWGGVAFFTFISAFANLYHALHVQLEGNVHLGAVFSLDPIAAFKAVLLSATLPLMVLYLGEVVSSADAAQIARVEREAAKERRMVDREAMHTATHVAIDANVETHSESTVAFECDECNRQFGTIQALSAHQRFCAKRTAVYENGHAAK
jgi:hypothetical protein